MGLHHKNIMLFESMIPILLRTCKSLRYVDNYVIDGACVGGITKNNCDLEPRFAVMDIFHAHRKGFYSLARGVLRRAGRLTLLLA